LYAAGLVDEVARALAHLDPVESVSRAARERQVLDDLADRPARRPRLMWLMPTPTTPAAVTGAGSRRRCARATSAPSAWICSLTRRNGDTHAGSHTAALLCIWYAVVGWTCACPAITVPTPPRAYSAR
jgi:hypothetical protein